MKIFITLQDNYQFMFNQLLFSLRCFLLRLMFLILADQLYLLEVSGNHKKLLLV